MKLFRCLCCPGDDGKGLEFEANKQVCPTCGADGGLVVELATIHYDPPSKWPNKGLNVAACDSKIRVGQPGLMMSGLPAAVTCKACKLTAIWIEQAAKHGLPVIQDREG